MCLDRLSQLSINTEFIFCLQIANQLSFRQEASSDLKDARKSELNGEHTLNVFELKYDITTHSCTLLKK